MNPAPAPAPVPSHPRTNPTRPNPTKRYDRGNRPSGHAGGRPGGATRRIQRILRRPTAMPMRANRAAEYFPEPVAANAVRIIPLGGVEEVGRNMTAIEVGATGDILVFDAGFQFVSEDASPGVDYILPNTKYLEKNASRVKGVIITHGHLDHIGGIPFILPRNALHPRFNGLFHRNAAGKCGHHRRPEARPR